jgi:hypothetical protein
MSTILKFPKQPNRPPVWNGELERGDDLPANVAWLHEPQQIEFQRSPELLLGILLLQVSSPDARKVVRHHIRELAAAGDVDAAVLRPIAEVL